MNNPLLKRIPHPRHTVFQADTWLSFIHLYRNYALWFVAGYALLRYSEALLDLDNFKITALRVNYQDFGLVKRGLIPSLVYPIAESAFLLSCVFTAIALGLVIYCLRLNSHYFKPLATQHKPLALRASGLMFLLISFAAFAGPQWLFDAGRMDHILWWLLAAAVWGIIKGGKLRILPIAALAVMPFVHEASLFLVFPPLIILWLTIAGNRAGEKPLIGLATAVYLLSFIGLLVLVGQPWDSAQLYALYDSHYPDQLPSEGALLVYQRTLQENLTLIAEHWIHTGWLKMIALLCTLAPSLYFCYAIANKLLQKQHFLGYYLPLSLAFAPLLLLGGDFSRWLGASISLQILYLYLYAWRFDQVQLFAECIYQQRSLIYLSVLVGLLMGALGHWNVFPLTVQINFFV